MTQLFPDIDLSRFAESPAQNGAEPLPAGEPVGVMAGLNSSLLEFLANFSPGDLGVCVVDERLQLTLPIPDWGVYSFFDCGDLVVAAAEDDPQTICTVPTNERAWVDGVRAQVTAGDNLLSRIQVVNPAGYGTDDRVVDLISITTSGGHVWWPDPGGKQAVSWILSTGPLLLEPGSSLRLDLNGTGVAATTVRYEALLRRSKLVRALAP